MKNKLFVIGIFFILLTGCVKTPKIVGISNLKILEKKDSVLISQMTTEIDNPNSMSITAQSLEYIIRMEEEIIGKGFANEEFTLQAKSISSMNNTVEINIKKLLNNIDLITQSDSFAVEMDITAQISPLGIKISKNAQIYFKLADLMENMSGDLIKEALHVKGLKINEINPTFTQMDIYFEFENRFPLNYTLDSLYFEVFDNEKMENLLGTTQKHESLKFEEKQTTLFNVSAKIKNIATGLSMFKKVFTNEKGFYIKGWVYIDFDGTKIKIPLAQIIEPI